MPGQKIYFNGFGVKGGEYKKLLEGNFKEEITHSITVNYSTNRDEVKKYFTYVNLRFDVNDFLDSQKGDSAFGALDIIEADFK